MILAYSRCLAGSLGASSRVAEDFREAEDRVERRAQLVADVGEQAVLPGVGDFGLGARRLQPLLGGLGGADVAHDRHRRGAVDVGVEAARAQFRPAELRLALAAAGAQAHGGGRRAVAARRAVERVEVGGPIRDMDEVEEAATEKARGGVAEQRRRFAVGGEHAAAAVVAQDEIADRAGERRIAFGAADGGAPAGAAGARADDQMQRRIGRGRRGDGGEPQTAERRRVGAESPAAQQRDQKQQRDREQIGEAQQRGRNRRSPLRAAAASASRGSSPAKAARRRRRRR